MLLVTTRWVSWTQISNRINNFFCSFVRFFLIFLSFLPRTSYDLTSGIVEHDRIFFLALYIYTHTIPILTSFLLPVLFLFRVVLLKEKRIHIYVCVFFFIAPFFSLALNQKKTIKDCICFMSFFFFFLAFVTNFKQTRLKTK